MQYDVHVCGVLTAMIASYMTGLRQGEGAKHPHDQENQARLAGGPDHGPRRGDVRGRVSQEASWQDPPVASCFLSPRPRPCHIPATFLYMLMHSGASALIFKFHRMRSNASGLRFY
jgi:hypothetical protein